MNILQKKRVLVSRSVVVLTASLLLSSCLVTSPYWGQWFDDRTQAIPFQMWTTHKTTPLRIECHQASHSELYSFSNWVLVSNLNAQPSGIFDPQGQAIYSAGIKMALPEACWRAEETAVGLRYKTAIRVTQEQPNRFGSGIREVKFGVFDKAGLECLGRENGKAANWFAYLSHHCTKKSSGSDANYMLIGAKS